MENEDVHGKFTPGTKLAKCYEILSDHKWHCGKHELPGSQPAGLIREISARGYNIDKAKMYCKTCNEENTHRRLVS